MKKAIITIIILIAAITGSPQPITVSTSWQYKTQRNRMDDAIEKYAWISSVNKINLDFPYQGPQRAMLMMMEKKSVGVIMIGLARGQFLCNYPQGSVNVRFDKNPMEKYTAILPLSSKADQLLIRGYNRFVKKLRNARTLLIETSIYNHGNQIFEFNVAGFKGLSE